MIYQFFTLFLPLASASVVGYLTYRFAIKSKKFDILYQHKVPAFKEVTYKLINYKAYCLGRITHLTGNPVSPYYDDELNAMHYHGEVAKAVDLNIIFLSESNKLIINQLLYKMEGISTSEIDFGRDQMMVDWLNEIVEEIEKVINVLYTDLNLKPQSLRTKIRR
jgi:hypothetical protein